jgi:F-type H+-transporting ATPase subunit b
VLIDWFTVGAQLLNFIILVWLMKRFLYQPVLDAIAAREQKIAAQLADVAAAKAQAHRQQFGGALGQHHQWRSEQALPTRRR